MLEAERPPAEPVLAIRVGSVRRQEQLEVGQHFLLPHPGSESCALEVTLFQQLASQDIPDESKSEVTCSIPVRTPNGEASQVKLRVRRSAAELASQSPKAPAAQDSMGLNRGRDYMDQHHLQQRIQSLIQDVLREQPDDPFRYMFEQLRRYKASEAEKSQEPAPPAPPAPKVPKVEDAVLPVESAPKAAAPVQESAKAPLVPVAPAKPRPPEHKAPRSGRSFVNPSAKEEVAQRKAQSWQEARQLTRAVIRTVLQASGCMRVAEESLREHAQKDAARELVSGILSRAREKAVAKALSSMTVHEQARLTVRMLLRESAVRVSPEYKRALARWTIHCAFRGAANIIGSKEDMWKDCFIGDHASRRVSLPMPIVFLNAESSWGNWLSGGSK